MGNNEMNTGNTLATPEKSSTGMDANLAALLSYLLGFITGIVFFILEKDSKYVKFHAMQSILVSVAIMIVNFILGLIPILGWILAFLISVASIILWIVLMIKAYKYTWFKLPVIGEIAEKQSTSIKI
ncbi:MAG: DUF4870 domain-containing protein [Dethiobacteria bacterium]